MWTRGAVTRAGWGTTGSMPTVPEDTTGRTGEAMLRAGFLPLLLPPPVVMHDPSDPTTWTVPVRWT